MTRRRLAARVADRALHAAGLAVTLGAAAALGALLVLPLRAAAGGLGGLPWELPPGLPGALLGSVALVALAGCAAAPVGVGAALWLEEYAPRGRLAGLLAAACTCLAGVPPVVWGLAGLALFARTPWLGSVAAAGAATLALVVLPLVILSARAALRAVPRALRDASYALGADRWRTIRHHVLPAALPGLLSGLLLALARGLGAAAPLLVVSGLARGGPARGGEGGALLPALPVLVFERASRPGPELLREAAAAIMVLLALVLLLSGLAAWMRDRWKVAGSW